MCLIITGEAKTVIGTLLDTPKLLADILDSNGDGIGAMYTTSKQKLRMPKILTKDRHDAERFLRTLPADDRELALHFRMKTHGNIDLANCHPYVVLDGQIGMMHNGVLYVDDSCDLTKSDTWHYIDQYVRPMLEQAPDLMLAHGWQDIVEDHIGAGNRFVLMNNRGDVVILNEHTGIHHGGMWFSNTYAWSPNLLIPGYKADGGKRDRRWWMDEEDSDWPGFRSNTTPSTPRTEEVVRSNMEAIRAEAREAVGDSDVDKVDRILRDYPITTFDELFSNYIFTSHIPPSGLSQSDGKIVEMLEKGMPLALQLYMKDSPTARKHVAECICYYGTWAHKETGAILDGVSHLDEGEAEHIRSIAQERDPQVPALFKPKAEELDPFGSTTPFEVGKTYRTRDGLGLRLVESINVADSTINVRDLENGLRSDRWMDGRCLHNAATGRDLMLPAVQAEPAVITEPTEPRQEHHEAIAGVDAQTAAEAANDMYAG